MFLALSYRSHILISSSLDCMLSGSTLIYPICQSKTGPCNPVCVACGRRDASCLSPRVSGVQRGKRRYPPSRGLPLSATISRYGPSSRPARNSGSNAPGQNSRNRRIHSGQSPATAPPAIVHGPFVMYVLCHFSVHSSLRSTFRADQSRNAMLMPPSCRSMQMRRMCCVPCQAMSCTSGGLSCGNGKMLNLRPSMSRGT